MGRILTTCEQNPIILYGSINLDMEEETRRNLPYLKQKRNDIYRVEDISKK